MLKEAELRSEKVRFGHRRLSCAPNPDYEVLLEYLHHVEGRRT